MVLAAIAGGVASHILFNRYEPRQPFSILSLILGPPTVISVLLCKSNSASVIEVLRSYAIHFASLIASVVAYRLSPYHPLASFPGPVICKITRLWAFYIVCTGKQHQYYKSLHDRYGTHVRTGPNHVQIRDADVLPTVMGIKPFRRGDRHIIPRLPGATGSLLLLIDPQEHAQRRKIWDRSMNSQAVIGYQDMLFTRIGLLVSQLENREGSEVDLASWLACFSFDFMGDLAFGGAFRLLEQGSDVDGYMRGTAMTSIYNETYGTIPWIKPFIEMFPGVGQTRKRFINFARASVLARKAQGSSNKDIFYYLLDEEGVGTGPPSLPTLTMEASLAIVAGSDTTGTALSNLFFYLLSNPEIFMRLRLEIDSVFPLGIDASTSAAAANMELLNGVINETLRLQPAVPNGVQRLLPRGSGGVNLTNRWIPEGTTVQVSAYSVHRDPRYFYPDPEHFCPDRWLESTPKSRLDQSAYFPFSYGPTNCAGKALALQEMRLTVCSLIQKFEFELAPGFQTCEWENNLKDAFILLKGKLPVQIKARK